MPYILYLKANIFIFNNTVSLFSRKVKSHSFWHLKKAMLT